MSLIGRGFLARHFESIVEAHPRVVFLAAGVADSSCADEAALERERRLVQETIRQCARCGWRLVYFSSAGHVPASYGHEVTEDAPPCPTTVYGRHKLSMERMISAGGIAHLILRLSNLVGEHQNPGQLVPALARQIRRGHAEIWHPARRDLLDVRDAVSLTDRLLRCCPDDDTVNLASGVSVPVEDIVDHLCSRLGGPVERHYTHQPDGYSVRIDKLRSILGHRSMPDFDPGYYRRVLDRYYGGPAMVTTIPATGPERPDARLRRDVESVRSLLDRLARPTADSVDDSRLLCSVSVAPTSERFIPYTVPLVLRQAEQAGFGADIILGLNNGFSCPEVLAGFERLPGLEVVNLETGDKPSLHAPARVRRCGATDDFAFAPPATPHRLFVLHQRAGPWSAGKSLIMLDVFGGLLVPNLERGWRAPRWTLLFDAESLFIERPSDPFFAATIGRARDLLASGLDARAAARELFAETDRVGGAPKDGDLDIASFGLPRLLDEIRRESADVVGVSTRFCAFRAQKTFRGVPVLMPTPADPISAMHLFYNYACGLLPGCFSMPGTGMLGRTERVASAMIVALSRYPTLYGEDSVFTVLAEHAGLRLRMSRDVWVTNRCPALDEEVGHPPRPAWMLQFAKWYRGFDQIEALFGRDQARSVLGPDRADVRAAGLAIAADRLRQTGDEASASALLERFADAGPAYEEIRRIVRDMGQEGS